MSRVTEMMVCLGLKKWTDWTDNEWERTEKSGGWGVVGND